jgi:hypothetical protein
MTMTEYEITQNVIIPASVKVMANTPEEALEIGLEMLHETGGEQGEQFWDNSIRVWDYNEDSILPVLENDW